MGSEDGGGGRPFTGQHTSNSDIKLVYTQQGKVISVVLLTYVIVAHYKSLYDQIHVHYYSK